MYGGARGSSYSGCMVDLEAAVICMVELEAAVIMVVWWI
jgi:hypothetical protein